MGRSSSREGRNKSRRSGAGGTTSGSSSGEGNGGNRRRRIKKTAVEEEETDHYSYDEETPRTKRNKQRSSSRNKAKVSDYSDNSPTHVDDYNCYSDDDIDDAAGLPRDRKSSSHRKHHHHHRSKKSSSREEERRKRRLRASKTNTNSSSSSKHEPATFKKYMYSAISATFFFMLFRELGLMGEEGSAVSSNRSSSSSAQPTFLQDLLDHPFLRRVGVGGPDDAPVSSSNNAQSQAAILAGTSTLGGIKSTIKIKERKEIQATMTKAEVMAAMVGTDRYDMNTTTSNATITSGRPIMYTFFEWIPLRNRGTQMSDEADIELMKEWKAAWSAAGWEPRVLTLEDAKRHPQYREYAPQLDKIQMLGVDGMGGNVIYNQLCFLRWLAMAVVGGGFMADYDVFPISKAPSMDEDNADDSSNHYHLPFDGNFTVYSKIKNSQGAGIPCLMSGRAEEWTRLAFAILNNGLSHAANTDTQMWSDMLALIDMRHDSVYQIHDVVAEGQDVLKKHGWTSKDCSITASKMAIHFSHEALRKGYIRPGETAEDRPYIIRRFLAKWHKACTTVLPMDETVLLSSSGEEKGRRM